MANTHETLRRIHDPLDPISPPDGIKNPRESASFEILATADRLSERTGFSRSDALVAMLIREVARLR